MLVILFSVIMELNILISQRIGFSSSISLKETLVMVLLLEFISNEDKILIESFNFNYVQFYL